ncbi:MAG: hypothetical protein HY735_35615 [Verrucomicrobia bacterium]|nr:hypothetical protein [Verrucomicrobiota bacterium]
MSTTRTLIGNSFPLSLVRRRVVITPESVEKLRTRLNAAPPASFWGHASTLPHANRLLEVDLTPRTERPALTLDAASLPELDGRSYTECWLLSPNYAAGFRPAPNAEVPPDQITGWQVLRLNWED